MHGERSRERSERALRSVESAILAIVVEGHPEPLPLSELLAEMTAEANRPERVADVERAVAGLVEVGLLRTSGHALQGECRRLGSDVSCGD